MTEPYTPNTDISLWRMAAVALCEYACGYDKGRAKTDPIYVEVTEGRDGPGPIQRRTYSSCGDQAWWLLYRLGLRAPWMNRAANNTYNIGMNVADLTGAPGHLSAPFPIGFSPQPGDILEIWNEADTHDSHVCVALAAAGAGHIRIASFGAGGMQPTIWPGSNISDSFYVRSGSDWVIGYRKLQRAIPLAAMVPLFTAPPNLAGAQLTGEVIDALGGSWSP